MSKERLEEIRERVLVDKVYYKYLDGTKGHWGKTYTLNEEDYNHLIEQAERAQELENVNRALKKANEGSERDKERLREWIDELEMENETLSSALHDARHEIRVLKNKIE